jgi:hypothetical protein
MQNLQHKNMQVDKTFLQKRELSSSNMP